MKRACGVLLPVTSLPSKYGIGCFSKEAYQFVDFLQKAGQSYWQVLPLGETSFGDSPYMSISTFAGNPLLIDLEPLIEKGWLSEEEAGREDLGDNPDMVDYEKQKAVRLRLLRTAYRNSPFSAGTGEGSDAGRGELSDGAQAEETVKDLRQFRLFLDKNREWLEDYALFCAEKESHAGAPYTQWEEKIRLRDGDTIAREKERLAAEMRFREFLQYLFFTQYHRLKEYANSHGIRIIGDLPIYVSGDGADVWSHPDLFQLDGEGRPLKVAGVPPDGFSPDGQLWGNPLYRWERMRETGYEWWTRRLESAFSMFDIVRIDHFRGFEAYFAVPYGETTARNGVWEKGPGYDFFAAMEKKLGRREVIAENLGFLTPQVQELLDQCGFPGMEVLQFAFDWSKRSIYLPQYYIRNCIAYTGTHDNTTLRDWYEKLPPQDREFADRYMGLSDGMDQEQKNWRMIACLLRSVADTVVVPLQDYLCLGGQARINTPSTVGGGNWCWRMCPGMASDSLAEKMRLLADTFDRLPK